MTPKVKLFKLAKKRVENLNYEGDGGAIPLLEAEKEERTKRFSDKDRRLRRVIGLLNRNNKDTKCKNFALDILDTLIENAEASMEAQESLKQLVADYHNCEPEDVQTVGDMFDSWEDWIAGDVEWVQIYDNDRREVHFCTINEPRDGTIYRSTRYYDVDDLIVVDDDCIERMAEYHAIYVDDIHGTIEQLETTDDIPIEFVGIRDNEASIFCGIENEGIVGIDQLKDAIGGVTMFHGGQRGARTLNGEVKIKARKDGAYGDHPDETREYILDKFLYQNADKEMIEDWMSELDAERFIEVWYDEEE